MTQNLTNQDRDLNFAVACQPLRETFIGEYTDTEEKLQIALQQTGITLSDCSFGHDPIIFFAIGNFSPVLLKFFVDNGALLSLENREGQSPVQFAKEMLKRVRERKSDNTRLLQLAEWNLEYLEEFMK